MGRKITKHARPEHIRQKEGDQVTIKDAVDKTKQELWHYIEENSQDGEGQLSKILDFLLIKIAEQRMQIDELRVMATK